MDSYFSQEYKRYVKCTSPRPGFELESPCLFPRIIIIIPHTLIHTFNSHSQQATISSRAKEWYVYNKTYYIQMLLLLQQKIEEQSNKSLHQMLALRSFMVLEPKSHYHKPKVSQQYLMILPNMAGFPSYECQIKMLLLRIILCCIHNFSAIKR